MGFIKKIDIENFYSIKNMITIDFTSSQYMVENNLDRTIEFKNKNYSILNGIYGANASGKSSIIRAFVAISQSITNYSDNKYPASFKNRFSDKRKRTKISLTFVVNKEEYLYELTLKCKELKNIGIHDESLYIIENDGNKLIFNRNKKKIINIDDNIKIPILNKLNENKSLVYEFMKFDKKLEVIYHFFRSMKYTTNIENEYLTSTIPSKSRIEHAL